MTESKKPNVSIISLHGYNNKEITIKGWVQNKREGKGLVFIVARDGSGFCQCVVSEQNVSSEVFEAAKSLTLESSFILEGKVIADERQMGGFELQVSNLTVLNIAQDYPISKKAHGVDFLMDKRHLWLRSRRQWAIMRIRNQIIYSIHNFFQEEGFVQMDAPIFTGNAVEGTTTLFSTEFFEEPAYLSQSGQLYGEAMAMAMGKIYTFGPTFRAEKSKTRRHLSEFWMIEPEMAFYDLDMNMDVIEKFLNYVVSSVIEKCTVELEVIERDVDQLKQALGTFTRLTYDEAVQILKGEKEVDGQNTIEILKNDLKDAEAKVQELNEAIAATEAELAKGNMKKGKIAYFEKKIQNLRAELKDKEEDCRNIPQWLESAKNFEYGSDLGGSDETVITRLFKTPVLVYNWPKAIKAFYMKEDENNPTLVRGVDVLAPEGYGEIVGGGERETNVQNLIDAIKKHDLPMEAFEWYLDLRRFGSVPHSGFGLGLERLVAWVCKLPHVRETIPFPRLMGRLFP